MPLCGESCSPDSLMTDSIPDPGAGQLRERFEIRGHVALIPSERVVISINGFLLNSCRPCRDSVVDHGSLTRHSRAGLRTCRPAARDYWLMACWTDIDCIDTSRAAGLRILTVIGPPETSTDYLEVVSGFFSELRRQAPGRR